MSLLRACTRISLRVPQWQSSSQRRWASTGKTLPYPKHQRSYRPDRNFNRSLSERRLIIDRDELDTLLRRRLFLTPSFEIYGGLKGLFDLGPPGAAMQNNLINLWRNFFLVKADDISEIDCTILTPENVFKASGHVEKFTDWMCRDVHTGEMLRADHLLKEGLNARIRTKPLPRDVIDEYENVLAQIDEFDGELLGRLIKKYGIYNPTTGSATTDPEPFNLMFGTSIGASGDAKAYLRPETAQGHFVNFAKLLAYHQNQLPFGSASIGKAFRNEVSPRSGLLRLREFMMAEIEYFVDPRLGKKHADFESTKSTKLNILSRESQLAGERSYTNISAGEAVENGIIANETVGVFLVRILKFLKAAGIEYDMLRFRQHLPNEMAHYAADCWDAEVLTSYGWIEVVGCADRSAFDITKHAEKTGANLHVTEPLEKPASYMAWDVSVNPAKFFQLTKKDGKKVQAALRAQTPDQFTAAEKTLKEGGKITIEGYELGAEHISISLVEKVVKSRSFIPHVIEPSFGLGRIMYAILEHKFWTRESQNSKTDGLERQVLSLPIQIAPIKVAILPIIRNTMFNPLINNIANSLRSMDITCKVDAASATIGRRYARQDEVGTPLAITLDSSGLEDGSVTLRDRDSQQQVRGPTEEVIKTVQKICQGQSWGRATKNLAPVEQTPGAESAQ